MTGTKLKFLLLLSLFILQSCKDKDPEPDQCVNGFKDAGETNIDCGGVCPDCPIVFTPSLVMTLNGKEVSFQTKSMSENSGEFYLAASNDSIDFQIDMGSNSAVGNYTLSSSGHSLLYKNVLYNIVANGSHAVASNNSSTRRIAGFFQMKFTRPFVSDTIYITNGQYSDLKY
ncbi:MAG: hypothetical protein KJ941_10340 [Bacteroidetes bacterium]|nr:hypothetical protein [Bacteroidota bacterium]